MDPGLSTDRSPGMLSGRIVELSLPAAGKVRSCALLFACTTSFCCCCDMGEVLTPKKPLRLMKQLQRSITTRTQERALQQRRCWLQPQAGYSGGHFSSTGPPQPRKCAKQGLRLVLASRRMPKYMVLPDLEECGIFHLMRCLWPS